MKSLFPLIILVMALFSCKTPVSEPTVSLPDNDLENETNTYTSKLTIDYNNTYNFPVEGELTRPEDGIALDANRIIVSDQTSGLMLIENGSIRPFGKFKEAGFVYDPPKTVSAPNGIFLEHDKSHLIITDLGDGKIFRVNIETEETTLIYDHPYGVNTAYRDRNGALWFTQSTQNSDLPSLFADVDKPVPHGALYKMESFESEPVKMVDSLYLASGLTFNNDESELFIAETMMDRVHRYQISTDGSLQYAGIAAHVGTPDNIRIDQNGNLNIASALYNQIILVNLNDNSSKVIFSGVTNENINYSNEWHRRRHLGIPAVETISPALWSPMPGLITGMFYSEDMKTLYVTGLGNKIIKCE